MTLKHYGIVNVIILCVVAGLCGAAQTTTIALNGVTAHSGSTASLNLQLSSTAGSAPAAIAWTVNAAATEVQSITAKLGPAASAATKSIYCSRNTCVIAGMNSLPIGNGTVAVLALQMSPTATGTLAVQLSNALAATSSGGAVTVNTIDGTVSVTSSSGVASVIPGSTILSASQSQQFSALIDSLPATAVTWSMSPQTGTLTSTGLYTAPSALPVASTVTITATTNTNPAKQASAVVTLQAIPVTTVSPTVVLGSSKATIQWTTPKATDSLVVYGTTDSYGWTTLSPALVTSHSVSISIGLVSGTTYHYTITSHDAQGHVLYTSQDSTFTAK